MSKYLVKKKQNNPKIKDVIRKLPSRIRKLFYAWIVCGIALMCVSAILSINQIILIFGSLIWSGVLIYLFYSLTNYQEGMIDESFRKFKKNAEDMYNWLEENSIYGEEQILLLSQKARNNLDELIEEQKRRREIVKVFLISGFAPLMLTAFAEIFGRMQTISEIILFIVYIIYASFMIYILYKMVKTIIENIYTSEVRKRQQFIMDLENVLDVKFHFLPHNID